MLGKKDILGIDIGANVVKVLEMKASGKKISVINYAEEVLEAIALEEKAPEERKKMYVSALKKIVKNNKFATKNAAISVSGSSVIVRFVKFPKMSASELEKTLQFEAEPHIPFDIQEVYMDTQVIGDVEEDDQTKMETVLVASKKTTIDEKIDIIEKAGFKPAVIDVDAFALQNAYESINRVSSEELVLLINIGASITNICILDNGISKVVRDLYTAGNSFTRAIQEEMQNSAEQAEDIKIKYGLIGDKSMQDDEDESKGLEVYNILQPVVKELNSEIQRSLDYFMGQQAASDINVNKIVLSGGSANMKGLPEMISSDLNIPVEIFRPLENAEVASSSEVNIMSPSLAVVAGLALRKIGDSKRK